MDKKRLDQRGIGQALNMKAGSMDEKQQAAWEIVQKMKALTILIDHYTELEECHKRKIRNDSLEFVMLENKEMHINESDFSSLLKMFKEATKFILERELLLKRYQENLDSRSLLESDPVLQKIPSMLTRIRVLETENRELKKRNHSLENDYEQIASLKEEIKSLKYIVREKDLEISVAKVNVRA